MDRCLARARYILYDAFGLAYPTTSNDDTNLVATVSLFRSAHIRGAFIRFVTVGQFQLWKDTRNLFNGLSIVGGRGGTPLCSLATRFYQAQHRI